MPTLQERSQQNQDRDHQQLVIPGHRIRCIYIEPINKNVMIDLNNPDELKKWADEWDRHNDQQIQKEKELLTTLQRLLQQENQKRAAE